MYFYKIDAQLTNVDAENLEDGKTKYIGRVKANLISYYQNADKGLVFIASMNDGKLAMGAIARDPAWLNDNIAGFLATAGLSCCDMTIEEITFRSLKTLIRISECNDYSYYDSALLKPFGIDNLAGIHSLNFTEHMLSGPMKKEELQRMAGELLCAGSLLDEIERIDKPATENALGHPVHYLIQADNKLVRDRMIETLLSALYSNGRLRNRRYSVVNMNGSHCDQKEGVSLYEACTDGAVVVKLGEETDKSDDAEMRLINAIFGYDNKDDDVNTETNWLETTCRTALKYHERVLTVFCLPRVSEKVKIKMREYLGVMSLVELDEACLSSSKARAFLRKAARERNVQADKALYKAVANGQESFSTSELASFFDTWYSKRLKTVTYPQYAAFRPSGQVAAKTASFGSAYWELEQLIGLHEAKDIIKQALDYFKAQKLLRDKGFCDNRPAMHMVFSGAPGTAKTTVARLFARILRENNLLSEGKLYEVGRADLVGKYVGWTAQKVKAKFTEAMGSVLFIDEAYSLVDDKAGMYGDEAISTIVAEMENRREGIVVIFAGYSEKMEEFLKRNPGLRSRIPFHVPFKDYEPEELMQILAHMTEKQSMTLDDSVWGKVLPILSSARKEDDFGNGRFVRNLFEKARMRQAGRLLAMDIDSLTAEQVMRLTADDFAAPATARTSKQRIGFNVA